MGIPPRRVLEYPFHSRLSRLACLAVGVALLWFGTGQLTVAGLLLMFSGLVIAVAAVQPPQPWMRSPDEQPRYRATSLPHYPTAQLPSNPAA